ncbi:MAG: hypothetical protein FWG03_09345 [Clostridiales bacterium]|nr:hypothetical protein [Clostridiales bacterium]
MYITITVEAEGRRYRVSIDERQHVSAAHAILMEHGFVKGGAVPALYKSALLEEWVSAGLAFEEQGIVSGDLLTAQE